MGRHLAFTPALRDDRFGLEDGRHLEGGWHEKCPTITSSIIPQFVKVLSSTVFGTICSHRFFERSIVSLFLVVMPTNALPAISIPSYLFLRGMSWHTSLRHIPLANRYSCVPCPSRRDGFGSCR